MRSEQELSHSLLNHFLSKYSISNQSLSVIVKLAYSGNVGGLALTLRQLFGPPLFQLASQPGPASTFWPALGSALSRCLPMTP